MLQLVYLEIKERFTSPDIEHFTQFIMFVVCQLPERSGGKLTRKHSSGGDEQYKDPNTSPIITTIQIPNPNNTPQLSTTQQTF